MITQGNRIGALSHFGIPFLVTGSNYTVSSSSLCLRMLEDLVVDDLGNFLYDKGSSIHPLHDAILKYGSYEQSKE